MQRSVPSIWEASTARQLAEVVTVIDDPKLMQQFLSDVMTEKEIIEISARLQAAKMLQQGKKYTEIIEQTKLSSRTIARISDWLQKGTGGYAAALQTINTHQSHTPPAR